MTEFTSDEIFISSNKPVIVDFWAPWCGPCKAFAPSFNELSEQYGDQLVFGKVNVDEYQELAMKYKIRGIPTLLIFKDGEVADTLVGNQPKDSVEKAIKRHIQ